MSLLVTIWSLIIAVFMWTPLPPGPPSPLGHLDLAIHAGLFLVLAQLTKLWIRPDINRYYWIDWALLSGSLALLFETGQWLVPGRFVSLIDYSVNLLAVGAGGLLPLNQDRRPSIWGEFSSGFLSLTVGFGGIFLGEFVFNWFIKWDSSLPEPSIQAAGIGLTLTVLTGLMVWFESGDMDGLIAGLLLPGAILTATVPSPWNGFIVLGAAVCLVFVTTRDRLPLAGCLIRTTLLFYLVCLSGALVSPQQFLDGFGLIWISINFILITLLSLFSHLVRRRDQSLSSE